MDVINWQQNNEIYTSSLHADYTFPVHGQKRRLGSFFKDVKKVY